jgi:hypothetical protein
LAAAGCAIKVTQRENTATGSLLRALCGLARSTIIALGSFLLPVSGIVLVEYDTGVNIAGPFVSSLNRR